MSPSLELGQPQFERVVTDPNSCLRFRAFQCKNLAADHAWHYHPQCELTWIIRSEGMRCVGTSVERYAEGDLALIGPNVPHYWHNDNARTAAELLVVQFDAAWLTADFLRLPEAAGIRNLLRLATGGVRFHGAAVERAGEALLGLGTHRGVNRLTRLIELLSFLGESTDRASLTSYPPELVFNVRPEYRDRVARVLRYVHTHLDDEISQADIAAQVGISAAALSRFFRSATGMHFIGYVNARRIDKACGLLDEGALSITAVALACGYDSISNFNRQFLAVKGMNPSTYRARRRRRDG